MAFTKRLFWLIAMSLLIGGGQQTLAAGYSISGQLEVLKKGGKRPLKAFDNAVVYLTGEGLQGTASAAPLIVEQSDKQFMPRILPLVKGQKVHFYNRDRFEHNVFSTDASNSFDLGRYPVGGFREQPFAVPGVQKVYCNIHKAMILDVLTLDNHYFSTTDKHGNFRIDGVPEGEYRLHIWHIYGGSTEQPIVVDQDVVVDDISITSLRVVRELNKHLNKEGKSYKKNNIGYKR